MRPRLLTRTWAVMAAVLVVLALNMIPTLAHAQGAPGTSTGIAASVLFAIGAVIATLTALAKGAMTVTDYPKWISLAIVGIISAVVLGLAVQSGRIAGGDWFELLAQWANFVMAGVGVREVATVPQNSAGQTLSDLPTRGM